MNRWYVAGVACVVATMISFVMMQVAKSDFLPPEISVSQYGVGGTGWIFSCFAVLVGAGPVCFAYARPVGRLALVLLWAGAIGALTMAVVRTDPSGLQHSLNSRIHTAGAVLLLVCEPFGMCVALSRAARRWRLTAWGLTTVAAVALVLLLLAAFGVDSAGVGPQASWAWWQSVATVADLALIVVHMIGVRTVPGRSAPERRTSASARG